MAQPPSRSTAPAALASRTGPPGQARPAGPSAVELHGIHKHFGHVHAVKGVDLTVASGEIVACSRTPR